MNCLHFEVERSKVKVTARPDMVKKMQAHASTMRHSILYFSFRSLVLIFSLFEWRLRPDAVGRQRRPRLSSGGKSPNNRLICLLVLVTLCIMNTWTFLDYCDRKQQKTTLANKDNSRSILNYSKTTRNILEVSPDEGFRREAEMSINSMFPGCFRVIYYSCSCQPDETFYRTHALVGMYSLLCLFISQYSNRVDLGEAKMWVEAVTQGIPCLSLEMPLVSFMQHALLSLAYTWHHVILHYNVSACIYLYVYVSWSIHCVSKKFPPLNSL